MSGNPTVTFETSLGAFTAELFARDMPITCANFIDLAASGFYDGLHFHRVIDGFMLQFGCPHSRAMPNARAGTGGPRPGSSFAVNGRTVTRDAREGNVPDEFATKTSNDVGTLSMANTGAPNSGGSQFFINTVHNDFLDWWRDDLSDSKHPVFGRVTSGMDVVRKIEKTRCDRNDAPVTPVKMIKVTVG